MVYHDKKSRLNLGSFNINEFDIIWSNFKRSIIRSYIRFFAFADVKSEKFPKIFKKLEKLEIIITKLSYLWFCHNQCPRFWSFLSFFQFGEWADIHVDRRLPANRAPDALKLLYSKRSKKDLDWWCPLLEKAYAKENFH